MGVEAAGRQVVAVPELARVGDPLVDEHHAGRVLGEQVAQDGGAGVSAALVRLADAVVGVAAAELPGELAPHGVDLGAVLLSRAARAEVVADDDCARDVARHGLDADVVGQLAHAREVVEAAVAGEVVDGQQAVGLAAAEGRHQVDDRVAADAVESAHRLGQQRP